jgi:hypothetical protein
MGMICPSVASQPRKRRSEGHSPTGTQSESLMERRSAASSGAYSHIITRNDPYVLLVSLLSLLPSGAELISATLGGTLPYGDAERVAHRAQGCGVFRSISCDAYCFCSQIFLLRLLAMLVALCAPEPSKNEDNRESAPGGSDIPSRASPKLGSPWGSLHTEESKTPRCSLGALKPQTTTFKRAGKNSRV